MKATPENIDELIGNYVAGEASPEQMRVVDQWRASSDENQAYFDHFRMIFEKAASVGNVISFDTDEAWNRVRNNIKSSSKTVRIQRNDTGFSLMKIAAGLALFAVAGIFAYQFFSRNNTIPVEILAVAETRADTLPEGSRVFLNRNTAIEYVLDKRRDTHIATLTGEAYFDIRHDDEKTFIVAAGETLIRDIGTSFNVTAYPESNTIEVAVDEGEVQFYTEHQSGIRLRAKERGLYERATGTFTVVESDPNITAYKTRSFTFNNHSLEAVVSVLNAVYDRPIRIDDKLRGCKLTVSFNEEAIEEIANVIAETLALSVTAEGDTLWLRGSGCGEAPLK